MELSKINPLLKDYYMGLPNGFQKNISGINITYKNNVTLIEKNLHNIYGNYADWENNINEYFTCEKSGFLGTRNVVSCAEIPEISIKDIKKMLKEEESYIERCNIFIDSYKKLTNLKTTSFTDQYIEMLNYCANLVGISPETNTNSLFHYMILNNNLQPIEKKQLTDSYLKNLNIIFVILTQISKLLTPGFTLEYPIIGTAITQQKREYYYRGENAYYGSSKPGLYREHVNNSNCRLINLLKIDECCFFLDKLDAIKEWRLSSVNYCALAQHYGIKTFLMDLTSDLKTALFFACCKYINGKWYPLDKKDFSKKDSRKNINGDSRYGILYRARTEINDMQYIVKDNNINNLIMPIGYQPFMRCSAQHGYMLLCSSDQYDMYHDVNFEKFKFRLNENICCWIYNEMEQGNKIYPENDFPNIEKIINSINNSRHFSEETIMAFAESQNITIDDIRPSLHNMGYSIRKKTNYISQSKLQKLNKFYDINRAESKITDTPVFSPIITI